MNELLSLASSTTYSQFRVIIPSVVALLADITKSETNRGKVIGIHYGIFFLAGIVGPIFGGYLGDVFSFNFVLYISVLILSLGLISSFKINLKHENIIVVLDEKASLVV